MNGLNPAGLANSPFFDNYATGINAYHPGLDFGRTRHGLEVEEAGEEALEADLSAVEAVVELDVRRAFFDVLRARELEEAARRAVESRGLNAQQAQAFYEGELRSKLDWNLARTLLAEAQAELIAARNRVRSAEAGLHRAMGELGPTPRYQLEKPELSPPSLEALETLVAAAQSARPEVIALERRIAAAQAAVELARSRRKPILSFFTTGGWARVTPLVISSLSAVGAGLAMPLFTFGKRKGEIEEAESYAYYLRGRFEEARHQVAFETRTTYFDLQTALEALPVRRLQAEYAQSAVDLATVRYEEQLGDVVALNEAESRLAAAEASRIAAAYEVQKLQAELRFATGRR
jgi:outer membrane protein TolC